VHYGVGTVAGFAEDTAVRLLVCWSRKVIVGLDYLLHRTIHRHTTTVHVIHWHTRVKLRGWCDKLRLHRIWIVVLDNTIEGLRCHRSELLSWSPCWTLRLREEWCILGPNIETFGIVSTLLGWLGSLVLACSVLGRD